MKTKYTWRIAAYFTVVVILAIAAASCKKEDPKPCVRYVQRNRMPDAPLPVQPVVLNPQSP